MTDDTFGFAGKRENTLTKLSSIRPSAESAKPTPLAEIDEAGRRAGFTSREPGRACCHGGGAPPSGRLSPSIRGCPRTLRSGLSSSAIKTD